MSQSKFYVFHQNNSGGSYEINDNVSCEVIIEATSGDDANRRAENIGIYFDGCNDGIDCECCGDRWYETDDDEGTDTPRIYGESVLEYEPFVGKRNKVYCIIHYMDGRKVSLSKSKA